MFIQNKFILFPRSIFVHFTIIARGTGSTLNVFWGPKYKNNVFPDLFPFVGVGNIWVFVFVVIYFSLIVPTIRMNSRLAGSTHVIILYLSDRGCLFNVSFWIVRVRTYYYFWHAESVIESVYDARVSGCLKFCQSSKIHSSSGHVNNVCNVP